jgi:hypothetical protein
MLTLADIVRARDLLIANNVPVPRGGYVVQLSPPQVALYNAWVRHDAALRRRAVQPLGKGRKAVDALNTYGVSHLYAGLRSLRAGLSWERYQRTTRALGRKLDRVRKGRRVER